MTAESPQWTKDQLAELTAQCAEPLEPNQLVPGDLPVGVALHRFANKAVTQARSARLEAEYARAKAGAVLLPHERDLVLKDLPAVPAHIKVSPDAMFAILDSDCAKLAGPNAGGWLLKGCDLPLVVDDKTRTGHWFRIETAEGLAIG